MAIAATIIADTQVSTAVALINMPTERSSSATPDRMQGAPLPTV
jgi:hypothetical protein